MHILTTECSRGMLDDCHQWMISWQYYIIISILIQGCYSCPIRWCWQDQAMLNTGSPCVFVSRPKPNRPHFYITLHTFRSRLSRPSPPSCAENHQDCDRFVKNMARCTSPDHLNHWLWKTALISSMTSFGSSEAQGASFWCWVSQMQWIMKWLLRWSRGIRSPCFISMEHYQVDAGCVHLGVYLRRVVPVGEDRQEFS